MMTQHSASESAFSKKMTSGKLLPNKIISDCFVAKKSKGDKKLQQPVGKKIANKERHKIVVKEVEHPNEFKVISSGGTTETHKTKNVYETPQLQTV